jgi:hypothetical protein
LATTVNSGLVWSVETPIVRRHFAKVQVEELGAHLGFVFCQGEGRGFESRRPLQRKSR